MTATSLPTNLIAAVVKGGLIGAVCMSWFLFLTGGGAV